MKIGITGQGGFIGSYAAKALSAGGHGIIQLDDLIRSCGPQDIAGEPSVQKLDWVLHFASKTSIKASFDDPFCTYSNNLNSTLTAMKIASYSKAAFLFMSSYVYGKPKYLPIDEKHPVMPLNPYMGSKIAGEEICLHLSGLLSIPFIILRGFNIYGNHYLPGRLISDVLESIRTGTPIVVNDPLPKRDYLFIKDFCSLLAKIVEDEGIKTGIYNVGYGHSYSNLEVAELASKIAGNRSRIVIRSAPRPNDVDDCSVDVSLVKNTFSWSPDYSLEDGLMELIKEQA